MRPAMATHFYEDPGNIIIDDCSRCSLNWLDYGDLMRIIRAPDHTYSTW
jgi:Zn-finger nucleic acid-binding protein